MLANVQLRTKVLAVVLVPVLALVAVVGTAAAGTLGEARRSARVARTTAVATDLSPVVHALQEERALVAVTTRRPDDESAAARLFLQRGVTDEALARLAATLDAIDLDDVPQGLALALDVVRERLDDAGAVRAAADTRGADPVQVTDRYTVLVDSLLDVSGELGAEEGGGRLGRAITAYVALQRTKELAAARADLLGGVFARDAFAGDDYVTLAGLNAAHDRELARFQDAATPSQLASYHRTFRGSSVDLAAAKLAHALASPAATSLEVEPTQWLRNSSKSLSLLAAVEERLAADLLDAAGDAEDAARTQAFAYAAGAVAALLAAVALVLLVTRSITRPLQQLTMAADAARTELPRVVAEIRHGDEEPARPAPIQVRSRDEIGRLATAFNAVNAVAVEVAAEQAALRANIADMIVNLARRNQSLLGRQLKLIDRLEAEERDPDALDGLFRLDNLATRMRRNAESLLVLAGSTPGRTWRNPVPLATVIRAAVSEVERYDRIDVVGDEPVGVDGAAAASVTHLLAELLENATTFSPPASRVSVSTRASGDVLLVIIADEGVGMDDEELAAANQRIARPPLVDAAVSKVLGFSVVGRIAQRFGIGVELHRSPLGGIVALVALPASVLRHDAVRPAPAQPAPVPAPALATVAAGSVPGERHGEAPAEAALPAAAPVAADPAEPAAAAPVGAVAGGAPPALARRVPGASSVDRRPVPRAGEAGRPSAERTRNRLAGFQKGFERGVTAATTVADQDGEAPS